MKPTLPHHADLRGAARLATDAAAGLADLVEAMHERTARLPGMPAPALAGRTRGITGLVYRTVRGATRLVGGSVDVLLGLLAPALAPAAGAAPPSPDREAIVAALNGVLGDHLATTANPLAITMAFRRGGQPLRLERAALGAAIPDAGPRLLVLLHGLYMNDLQWQRDGHDHGAALARDHGWTTVHLHYNTGRHISTNAQALAPLMERLVGQWPVPVQRLAIVGHSMGGLVARSAVHHATSSSMQWPARLNDLVFLGTPHHGAPLERAGHWIEMLLDATPYSAPLARLTRVRSAGITDLRHGYLVDADWADRAGPAAATSRADHRQHLPLPAHVACSAVAATLGAQPGHVKGRLLGDGLVPLASALGRHRSARRTLAFADGHQWTGAGLNHLQLLSSPAVYAQLSRWLA